MRNLYYIYIPKPEFDLITEGKVMVMKGEDDSLLDQYGAGDGPFRTKDEVVRRLNEQNVPVERRPKGFKCQVGYVQIANVCIKRK